MKKYIGIILAVGFFAFFALVYVAMGTDYYKKKQAPDQPIAFSHKIHAGKVGLQCLFCHETADKSTFAGVPAVDTIRRSDLVPGLGVATGVNFGRTMVGTFGPNHAFTAFGREMNNTARLQGVATFQEIVVMKSARDVLAANAHPLDKELAWGAVREATVKNVKEPLRFYGFPAKK